MSFRFLSVSTTATETDSMTISDKIADDGNSGVVGVGEGVN